MAELMEASDLLIAKTGGITTSESLCQGLPMVVMRPIPGQESRNAKFLKTTNAAFFMETADQIKIIIRNIRKHSELLETKKETISRIAKPHAARDLAEFLMLEHSHESK